MLLRPRPDILYFPAPNSPPDHHFSVPDVKPPRNHAHPHPALPIPQRHLRKPRIDRTSIGLGTAPDRARSHRQLFLRALTPQLPRRQQVPALATPDSPTPLKNIPFPFPNRKYFDTQFHLPDHLRSAPPAKSRIFRHTSGIRIARALPSPAACCLPFTRCDRDYPTPSRLKLCRPMSIGALPAFRHARQL